MITLSDEQIRAAADELFEADRTHTQISPLSETHQDLTLEDAYAVQERWIKRKISLGDALVGYKIGLTSRTMQRAMQIDEPDYGVILHSTCLRTGATITAADHPDPMIEVELAFVLKDRLFGEDLMVDDVMSATESIVPSLELISARSERVNPNTGRRRTVIDTIADNAAYGAIIMGDTTIAPESVDVRWCGGIITKNGTVEETGLAAAVMGHPAHGICWIAKRFAAHDIALEPGQILLSGSFTAPVRVQAGDQIHVDYGPHGQIGCAFV